MKIGKLLAMVCILPTIAFAGGGQIGNGADSVVCTAGFRINAQLLDIFEARLLYGMNWIQTFGNKDDDDYTSYKFGADDPEYRIRYNIHYYVKKLLRQLDLKLPIKSARLHSYLDTFFDDAIFLSGVELTDIPDSLQIVLPGSCKLAQLVVQITNPKVGQKRYTINGDLWNAMDSASRIATVLHEIIYRDQVSLGHKDSRWTRYFVAMLFSNSIEKMSPTEIQRMMRADSLEYFLRNGLELLGPISVNQDIYQIVGADASSGIPKDIIDGRFSISMNRVLDYSSTTPSEVFGIHTEGLYSVELDEKSQPKKAFLSQGKLSNSVSLFGEPYSESDYAPAVIEGSSDGSIFFRGGYIRLKSKNGVIIETLDVDSWWLKQGSTFEDFLRSEKLYKYIPEIRITGKVIFASGNISLFGRFNLITSKNDILEIWPWETTHQVIENKIPPNTHLEPEVKLASIKLAWEKIAFRADGSFSFKYIHKLEYSNEGNNLVLKDGSIITISPGKQYNLDFDEKGYIISVIEMP